MFVLMPVSTLPGAIALTRTPCLAYSTASAWVSAAMPPFDDA